MEVSHSEKSIAADAQLNDALETEGSEESVTVTDNELRAMRIDDLSAESLQNPDSFQACLGAAIAGIMKNDQILQERITRALATDSGALSDVAAVVPTIDISLRLERQAERYGQLNIKLKSMDQKSQTDKSKLQAHALGGFVQEVTTRRRPQLPPHW
jgi:hypothetical protein